MMLTTFAYNQFKESYKRLYATIDDIVLSVTFVSI